LIVYSSSYWLFLVQETTKHLNTTANKNPAGLESNNLSIHETLFPLTSLKPGHAAKNQTSCLKVFFLTLLVASSKRVLKILMLSDAAALLLG